MEVSSTEESALAAALRVASCHSSTSSTTTGSSSSSSNRDTTAAATSPSGRRESHESDTKTGKSVGVVAPLDTELDANPCAQEVELTEQETVQVTSSTFGTPSITAFSTPREENAAPTTPVGEPIEQTFPGPTDGAEAIDGKSDTPREEKEEATAAAGDAATQRKSVVMQQAEKSVCYEEQSPSVVTGAVAGAATEEKSEEVSSSTVGRQLDAATGDTEEVKGQDEGDHAMVQEEGALDHLQDEGKHAVQDGGQCVLQDGEAPHVREEPEHIVQDEVKVTEQAEHEPEMSEKGEHTAMHDEVLPAAQEEKELGTQEKKELATHKEMEPEAHDEAEPDAHDEVEHTAQDEVALKAQEEVELATKNAVEIAVQDGVEPVVEDVVMPEAQGRVELTTEEASTPKHEAERTVSSPKRPVALNLVHHDIDDEASDSEDEAEEAASEDAEVDADLGTPLGYASAAGFGEGQDDFASHRFLGPSVASDPSSARALHSLRRVALHDKPPRFASEAPVVVTSSDSMTSSGESSGRNSSSASAAHASDDKLGLRSQSVADSVERSFNSYTLTFTEAVLGFETNVVMSLEKELLVEVSGVEKDSPAHRGGVVVGDCLVSVNGQHIEPHTTNEQVLEIIQTSSVPRTLVFQRDVHDKDAVQSKSLPDTKHSPAKPLIGRLGAAMSQGASIIGSRWKRKKTLVHSDSFCDGCGMDPITGALWTCSVCANYNLCSECYDMGTHGMENSEQMQALSEATVQYKLQKKCKHFTPEFLLSLRRDICKGRPDKFEYLGEWIADIVMGTSAVKITVRGIEIPSLPPASRQRFVSHLMPLVSNRTDIEVHIEWLPDDSDRVSVACRASVDRMSAGAFDSDEDEGADHFFDNLEKLRIWISDKKTRTTSPFA
ncbi:unnamed protein product [Hyaloperonospora brassicae]|uniref:ZZ-type domain-containing protein n=1 Tax=Hyaloperonospora brassicae TaxID=162125 RepID=A0AAV0UWG1_HYABA|nr:unnamed protein product [Hyaloperonospora brassicae]